MARGGGPRPVIAGGTDLPGALRAGATERLGGGRPLVFPILAGAVVCRLVGGVDLTDVRLAGGPRPTREGASLTEVRLAGGPRATREGGGPTDVRFSCVSVMPSTDACPTAMANKALPFLLSNLRVTSAGVGVDIFVAVTAVGLLLVLPTKRVNTVFQASYFCLLSAATNNDNSPSSGINS